MTVEVSTGTPVEFPDDRVNRDCNPEYIGIFYNLRRYFGTNIRGNILLAEAGCIILASQDSADPAGINLNNLYLKLADAVDAGFNLVADLNRTNSIGCSGINEVAGRHLVKLR